MEKLQAILDCSIGRTIALHSEKDAASLDSALEVLSLALRTPRANADDLVSNFCASSALE